MTIEQRRVAAIAAKIADRQGRTNEPTIEQRRVAAIAAKIADRNAR